MFKTTESGEIIFETFLSGFFPTSVKQSGENFIITKRVGTGGTYTTAIVEIDNSGNIVFESSIPDGGNANDVLVLENNKYFVSGGTQPCGCGGSWDARATLFSSSEVEWSNSFCVNCGCSCNVGDEMHQESIDVGSGIIVCGKAGTGGSYSYGQDDGYLIKYDYAGNHLWTQIHGENDKYTSYMSIEESDNNIIGVGRYIDDEAVMTEEPADIWVVKSDLDGNIIWEKNIGDPDTPEVGYDIMLTDYGTYIISGVINEYNDASQIWLVELDSEGYLLHDTIIETSYSHARIGHQSLLMNEDNELFVIYRDDNNIYISKFQMYNENLDQSCLSDTSYTEATACDSYDWNGETYNESGTYDYSVTTYNNNFSLDFNNQNDWISIPPINTGNNYTLQIWAEFPLPITLDGHNTFFSDWNLGGEADITHLFFHNICGLGIGDQFASGNCNVSGVYGTGFMPSSVSNGWHLITAVSEPNQTTFYIDNQNVGSVNHSVSSHIVAIGNNGGGNGVAPQNTGNIDMPTIWDYSLSTEEIEQHLNCPPTGGEAGLISFWDFEEVNGNIALDQTGNENHGTINGAIYSTDVPEQSCQLTTVNGCDSVAVLDLTIIQPDTSFAEITACESYEWNGQTYTESGNYIFSSQYSAATAEIFLCSCGWGGYFNEWFSLTLADGITTEYFCENTSGWCPETPTGTWINPNDNISLLGLEITNVINNSSNFFSSTWDSQTNIITISNNYDLGQYGNNALITMSYCGESCGIWQAQGILNPNSPLVFSDGTSYPLQNISNCDSVAMLNLTILNSNTEVDVQEHCDTYTWIDGNTYTSSNNTATWTLTNAAGCDSVVTLDLIINNSDNTSSGVIACDEFTWDGITYTENGEYTNTYINVNGCDSTHTLNLTINYTTFGSDTQEHCDTYTWIDGNTYIESNNTATFTLTNSNNCNSIVTLDLLITQSSSSYDTVVVCDSYDWNGNTYTESGNHVYTSSNTIGCDSVANLELSISQLETLVIDGAQIGYTETDNNTYSISNSNASSTYFWNLSNNLGTIETGNTNNSEITISWGENDSETTLCVYEQDEYSCEGEESCVTIDVKRPTSIDDIEESLLSIYPNPFENQTTVSFSNPTQSKVILNLIDSRGRTVRNYDGITGDSIIIKKEELSEGLYYIQLNLNNNVIRKPIVIQ